RDRAPRTLTFPAPPPPPPPPRSLHDALPISRSPIACVSGAALRKTPQRAWRLPPKGPELINLRHAHASQPAPHRTLAASFRRHIRGGQISVKRWRRTLTLPPGSARDAPGVASHFHAEVRWWQRVATGLTRRARLRHTRAPAGRGGRRNGHRHGRLDRALLRGARERRSAPPHHGPRRRLDGVDVPAPRLRRALPDARL